MKPTSTIIHGDCLSVLPTLPEQSVQCCVTSPPYWGLRDYGVDGQLGSELNQEYIEMGERRIANPYPDKPVADVPGQMTLLGGLV